MGTRPLDVDWVRYDLLLGNETDGEVAQKIGCSESVVRRRRVKLKIPPLCPSGRLGIEWGKWDAMLGQTSDAELARQIGCTWQNVRRRRVRLRIAVSVVSSPDPEPNSRLPITVDALRGASDVEIAAALEEEVVRRFPGTTLAELAVEAARRLRNRAR